MCNKLHNTIHFHSNMISAIYPYKLWCLWKWWSLVLADFTRFYLGDHSVSSALHIISQYLKKLLLPVLFFFSLKKKKSLLLACPTHTNLPARDLEPEAFYLINTLIKVYNRSTKSKQLYLFHNEAGSKTQHTFIMKLSGSNTQHIFFMIGIFKDVVAGSNAQHIFVTMNPSPLLL